MEKKGNEFGLSQFLHLQTDYTLRKKSKATFSPFLGSHPTTTSNAWSSTSRRRCSWCHHCSRSSPHTPWWRRNTCSRWKRWWWEPRPPRIVCWRSSYLSARRLKRRLGYCKVRLVGYTLPLFAAVINCVINPSAKRYTCDANCSDTNRRRMSIDAMAIQYRCYLYYA